MPVCVYMCQPVSKIFIGFGLTVYLENSLHRISAEKKVKGNVCCLAKWQAIIEVILSQMDLFFIIKKKVYEEIQVFHFKDSGKLLWKLTNILKSREEKS